MARRNIRKRGGRAQTGGRLPESQGLARAVSALTAVAIVAAVVFKVLPF